MGVNSPLQNSIDDSESNDVSPDDKSKQLYYVPPSKISQSTGIASATAHMRNSSTNTPYHGSPILKATSGGAILNTSSPLHEGRSPLLGSSMPPIDLTGGQDDDNVIYISSEGHDINGDRMAQPMTPTIPPNEDDIFMSTIRQIRYFKFEKKHKKKAIHYLLGLVPILTWLPAYNVKRDLRGDILAGITIGVMLVPQGMAYAMVANLPPIYGLYSSIIPVLAYAIFGTSRQLSVGPFAIISILVLQTVDAHVGTENQDMILRTSVSILLALVCGLYQTILGLMRFGFVANFLSDPVKSGFISGSAIIIGSSQIKHIFGIYDGVKSSNFLPLLIGRYLVNIQRTNWWAVLIAVVGIILLFGIKKINSRYSIKLPGPLIVVIIFTLISFVLKLEQRANLSVVGHIESGFPTPRLPTITYDKTYNYTSGPPETNILKVAISITPGALVLVLVGFISSVSVGAKFAEKYGYTIEPNQELLSLGLSDFIGAFFLSFPVGASLSRTAVNAQSGAATQVASLISTAIIVFSIFFLTKVIYFLPRSILASIVIVAVSDLVEYQVAIQLWKVHRKDLMLFLISFFSTIFLGILQGILIGLIASLLLIVYRSAYPPVAVLGRLPGTEIYKNIKRVPQAETFKGIKVVRIDGSIYFANTQYIKKKLRHYEPNRQKSEDLTDSESEAINEEDITVMIDDTPVKGAIIIDCSSMNDMDSTGLRMLKELVDEFRSRQLVIYFASVKGYIRDQLKKGGVVEHYGADHFFWTINDAVEHHLFLIRQSRRSNLSNSVGVPSSQQQSKEYSIDNGADTAIQMSVLTPPPTSKSSS
eukprot:gene19002-22746_t